MNKLSLAVLCGLNARYVHTNLALRSLRAYVLEQWPDAPAQEIVECTINDQPLAVLQRLYARKADVYAFSCYIWNITLIRRISRDLRRLLPEALIIWGGPEAGADAVRCLQTEPQVDAVIRGEGEAAWLNLLQVLADNPRSPDLSQVPGLSWRSREEPIILENPSAPLLTGGEWPFPYSDDDLTALRDRILYYETSRGCPFSCSYCLSALDRTVRYRPLPAVLAEIDRFLSAGLRQVKLVDRTFNCDPDRAYAIWHHIITHAAAAGSTNFHFEVAGDLLDDRTTDLLNQAPPGLIQLEIGVQTVHPDVLAAIRRPARLDQLSRQVSRLRRGGRIHLHLDLIAGLPGEGLDRFGESLDWVWELQPHQLQLGFLKVLPGSPIHDDASRLGLVWQAEPPYEILRSDALSFDELIRLKQIEWVIDQYLNSGFCARALLWLAARFARPWLALSGLAGEAAEKGAFDRHLGPADRCRLLFDFALRTDPVLAASEAHTTAWRDMLRLDYQLSGQKDQPDWLSFTEHNAAPEHKKTSAAAREHFRHRHPDAGRLRIERLSFDPSGWQASGAGTAGVSDADFAVGSQWLACIEMSGNCPILLDICQENDLY